MSDTLESFALLFLAGTGLLVVGTAAQSGALGAAYRLGSFVFGLPEQLVSGIAGGYNWVASALWPSFPGLSAGERSWAQLQGGDVYNWSLLGEWVETTAYGIIVDNAERLFVLNGRLEDYVNALPSASKKLFVRPAGSLRADMRALVPRDVEFVPNVWWARQHLRQMPYWNQLYVGNWVISNGGPEEYAAAIATEWDTMPDWVQVDPLKAKGMLASDTTTLRGTHPRDPDYLTLVDRIDRVRTLLEPNLAQPLPPPPLADEIEGHDEL